MRIFALDERQTNKYVDWKLEHDKTCPLTPDKVGAIGGKITFMFIPTSLGCMVIVKCACGAEVDLSFSEDW